MILFLKKRISYSDSDKLFKLLSAAETLKLLANAFVLGHKVIVGYGNLLNAFKSIFLRTMITGFSFHSNQMLFVKYTTIPNDTPIVMIQPNL